MILQVHNDADVESYKRLPMVRQGERCATVTACKHVHQVIENAPLNVTDDFMREHRIDVVVCSSEYDVEGDEYYAEPRASGILKVLPRTEGVSSSMLISSIARQPSFDFALQQQKKMEGIQKKKEMAQVSETERDDHNQQPSF